MGKYKPGAIGVSSGAIDTIVTSKWKSIFVIKGKPSKSNKPPALSQVQQRSKFGLVTAFLKRIASTIAVGYQYPGKNLTPMNVASRYHLNKAVTGVYPDYAMDMTKLQLTVPSSAIDSPWDVKLELGAAGLITMNWNENKFPSPGSLPTDRMATLLYDVAKESFINLGESAARSELTNRIEMPEVYAGASVHMWIYYISVDRKTVSTTNYLGLVKLLA